MINHKFFVLVAGIMLMLTFWGCANQPPNPPFWGKDEMTAPGTIRTIDWYHRTFIFEGDNGQILVFGQLCQKNAIPGWQGMHVQLGYRWIPYHEGVYTSECYIFDWVKHLPPDVK